MEASAEKQREGPGKRALFLARSRPGTEEFHQADGLTRADQEIPDRSVKVAFLGETEAAIPLGVKCWFADVTPHRNEL